MADQTQPAPAQAPADKETTPRDLENGRSQTTSSDERPAENTEEYKTSNYTHGDATPDATKPNKRTHPQQPSHWRLVFSHSMVTDEVLRYPYHGSGTDADPYQVEFIEHDPRNPMLFSPVKKWSITMLVAFATLAVAFTSSAYSGGVEEVILEFGCSQEVATLGVSLFVLGFAIGPLFWAPFSELYGRQLLFTATYGVLTAFNAGGAGARNVRTLIVLRFMAGAFGSSPLTNAGGVIADMFASKQRGVAMAIFAAAPFMGPAIGPIIGGFVGETIGWRWIQGVEAIFTGALWIIGSFLIPETYAPVLLRKRAADLSARTGKVYRSRIECGPNARRTTPGQAFKTAIGRPWVLLLREPIVFLLSIYMAIIYGTLYMLFAAFPVVFQQSRGWSQGIGGLSFLGIAVGFLIAVGYVLWDNKRYEKTEERHKANGEISAPPEARLPPAIVGSICLPVGMFWFAWTNYPSLHWIVCIIGTAPFGFGMLLVFTSVMNYLIDAYTVYAASVLAANSVLRSLFGAAFPLFTSYMYQNLGIHWASSIPAFLALMCVPFPFLFYSYGPAIRKRCKFAAEAMKIMQQIKESEHQEPEEEEEEEKNDEAESPPAMSRVSTRRKKYDEDSELERARTHASRF